MTFPKCSLRTSQQKKKWVRSGQVTRAGLLTPPQKSLQTRQSLSFSRSYFLSSSLQNSTCSMCRLYISEFLICDLRLGQSRDLYIASLWKSIEMRPAPRVNESKPPNSLRIMTNYLICNDPGAIYWQGHRRGLSEPRSCEVISTIHQCSQYLQYWQCFCLQHLQYLRWDQQALCRYSSNFCFEKRRYTHSLPA